MAREQLPDESEEMPDTSRVWRNRSRTFDALTSARVHQSPSLLRGGAASQVAANPNVSQETVEKLMDVLEMLTGAAAHTDSTSTIAALENAVASRRPKSNTPHKRGQKGGQDPAVAATRRKSAAPRCATPPRHSRWHSPAPADKHAVDDSHSRHCQSQSSLETSSFITGDQSDEFVDPDPEEEPQMYTARTHQPQQQPMPLRGGGAGRRTTRVEEEQPGWETPSPSDDEDEAPLPSVACSPGRAANGPVRLPPFHPAPRRRKQSEQPSPQVDCKASVAIFELEAELAREKEASKKALGEKLDTEQRLTANVAKNEELQGKLKRLAEGMMMATTKISDLESRLAEKAQHAAHADSSSTDCRVSARGQQPVPAARLAELEASAARIRELEARLEERVRAHEESLARAEEESCERLQASEAERNRLEEQLEKQQKAAASVESATLELFADLQEQVATAQVLRQEQVASKDQELQRLERKLEDCRRRAEEAEADLARSEDRAAPTPSAGSDGIRELERELEERRQQIGKLEGELEDRQQRLGDLEGELEERGQRLGELEGKVEERDRQLGELQAEAKTAEERLAHQLELAASKQAEAEALEEKLREQLALVAAGDIRVSALEEEAAASKDAKAQAEKAAARIEQLEAEGAELQEKLREQLALVAAGDARASALQEEAAASKEEQARGAAEQLDDCERRLRGAQDELQRVQEELQGQREDAKAQADKAAARIGQLEAQLSGQQTALDEVLARTVAEHTERLLTSEARGHELEVRLARLSVTPAAAPPADSVDASAQTQTSGGDSDALKDAVRTACSRLGADWAQWLRRASGRRLILPAWRGVYFSFPKAVAKESDGASTAGSSEGCLAAEEEARDDEDGVPQPPGSDFWDWPLSRRERRERAVFVDRQVLLADQRALMEHAEVLHSSCLQNGVEVVKYLWD